MSRILITVLLLFVGDSAVFEEAAVVQVDTLPILESVSDITGQEMISDSEEHSDWALFIGRFHPIFVHLPIGFLLMAFLLEFVGMIKRYNEFQQVVPFALLIGCLSGVLAGITGYLLSTGGGYGEDALAIHKWMGIGLVVLSGGAFILRITLYKEKIYKSLFRFLLIVIVMIVMGTGHLGGNLTHGSDYLFRYMPEPFRSWIGHEIIEEEQIELIENLDDALVYEDIIHPILKTRCESCHNPDRTEADLLLTSHSQILAGGKSGPAVVLHNSNQSELYTRLILPERDENRMPPKGRRQLTNDQIKLIAWWIDQGAPSNVKVPELEAEGEVTDILVRLTADGQDFYKRISVAKAEDHLLDSASEKGFHITPIAENLNFLQVQVSKSLRTVEAEDMEALLPLSEQIIWLDLSRLNVMDDDLQKLSQFRYLRRLSLQETAITDSTLMVIGSMEHLEYLNVYGTQITGAGLKYLVGLPNLKSLYLWQTDVSNEAIEELQNKMPKLYIDTGWK